MTSPLEQLKAKLYDIDALEAAIRLFDWDQQCYMPKGAGEARAEHQSRLTRIAHSEFTSDELGNLIEAASKEASGDDALLLKRVKRDYGLATKLPGDFVAERTKSSSLAFDKWLTARASNDFAAFAPYLEKQMELARQEAEYRGYKADPYDALFDVYEEGATVAEVKPMFEAIQGPLTDLVKEIGTRPVPDDSFLHGKWSDSDQSVFTEKIARAVGYDFNRGRQDVAAHPFCTGWSVNDVRITTRYKPYLGSAIFGTLHESGHAMYEQGSPQEWDRTLLAGGVSLGIHESQSRLWENIVGRSRAFWSRYYPDLQSAFPGLNPVGFEQFYHAINLVRPSLIRVEADEVTYNLHIIVRFELEIELLNNRLAVKDIPEAWNEKYRAYLGVVPSTDTEGCLQDVHWSGGSIGYFPTYSIGTVLSYQIWNSLQKDLPDVDAQMEAGNFESILGWLTEKIYSKGKSISPKDLIKQVTGEPLSPNYYLQGIRKKYSNLYGLG